MGVDMKSIRASCADAFEDAAERGHPGHRFTMRNMAKKIREGRADDDMWVVCAKRAVEDACPTTPEGDDR